MFIDYVALLLFTLYLLSKNYLS